MFILFPFFFAALGTDAQPIAHDIPQFGAKPRESCSGTKIPISSTVEQRETYTIPFGREETWS